ncbi:MAG: hypothetical protein WC716_16455 [Chitinophagaceae bacterium]|jgi:hypothetical protein
MALQYIAQGGAKSAIGYDSATGEFGFLCKMVNKTGAPTVKGTIVRAGTAIDNSFIVTPTDSDEPIGVIQEAGIADDSAAWIWMCGSIAQVLLQDSTASTRGYWVRTSTTAAGRANATSADPPGGGVPELMQHMCEIGHCLESKTAGTAVLALVILHFN